MKKPINTDKIFETFDKEDKLKDFKDEVDEFKHSIEMFTHLVLRGENWKKQIVKFFQNSNVGLDTNEINQAGDFMLYNRAWGWVRDIEYEKEDWSSLKEKVDPDEVLLAILRCIKYFEIEEEYEKCSFFVKLKDSLKKA